MIPLIMMQGKVQRHTPHGQTALQLLALAWPAGLGIASDWRPH